jgi:hypothetical protein
MKKDTININQELAMARGRLNMLLIGLQGLGEDEVAQWVNKCAREVLVNLNNFDWLLDKPI